MAAIDKGGGGAKGGLYSPVCRAGIGRKGRGPAQVVQGLCYFKHIIFTF